jgi:hypothetical protein
MADDTFEVLKSCVSSHVWDDAEIGWEETTLVAVTDLLRIYFPWIAKELGLTPGMSGQLAQCETLKTAIASLYDRIESCGGKLTK